jgi:hypothetical protein
MAQKTITSPRPHKSVGILLLCLGYLVGGLIWIPFAIGAFSTYHPGVPNSSDLMQLGAIMLVLVLLPIFLSFSVWKGYKFAWWLAMAFACFNIALYLITFSALNISLSTGPLISSSPIGPLGYAIAYGITYLGTYLLAVIQIIFNLGLIYFITRKRIMAYFGM